MCSSDLFHEALFALVGPRQKAEVVATDRRDLLQWDKQRVLHAIKELEFDHKMGKINAKDFQELSAPLRLRAVTLMEDLDRIEAASQPAATTTVPKKTTTATTVEPCLRCCCPTMSARHPW